MTIMTNLLIYIHVLHVSVIWWHQVAWQPPRNTLKGPVFSIDVPKMN